MSSRVVAAVCTACLVYVLVRLSNRTQRRPQLPGPRGWPLLSYLNPIQSAPWITYRQWSDEYPSANRQPCLNRLNELI